MKRQVLIILLLISGLCMSHAESSVGRLYKKWMIEDINKGDFEKAAREMAYVEDWVLDVSAFSPFSSIEVNLSFAKYADSIGVEKEKIDTLLLYTGLQSHVRAVYYYEKGEINKAIQYFQYVAWIYQMVLGEQDSDYAAALSSLGEAYNLVGDYDRAEGYFMQAKHIFQSNGDEQHPNYARLLSFLGNLYFYRDNYVLAEKYYLQELDIVQDLGDESIMEYAQVLINLGNMYVNAQDYEQAERYLLKARSLFSGQLYDVHKTTASKEYSVLLKLLGDLLAKGKHDYERAFDFYLKTVELFEEIGDTASMDYADVFQRIGNLCVQLDYFDQAELYLTQAIEIYRSAGGSLDILYNLALQDLGNLYEKEGDYFKAKIHYDKCISFYRATMIASTKYALGMQRTALWSDLSDMFENNYPLLVYKISSMSPSISTAAYNNELFRKGLLLTSSIAIQRSVLESGDTMLINRWETLVEMRQQMQNLESRDPQSLNLQDLKIRTAQLEEYITKSSAAYRENMRQWNITWDSVRAELKPNEVAIEFMAAPLNADSTMYCALLLRDTCSYPILIPLFEQNEVAGLVDVSMPMSLDRVYAYSGYGKQLSQIVWKKIMPYIQANEAVYFAPTGVLHQLAIENLPYDATHTMSDVYQMVRVSSTRELALHKPALPHQKAALYGGIFYEADATDLLVASMPYHRSVTAPVSVDSLERSLAQYLPATKTEVEQIRQTLKTKNIDVHIYSAIDGNEESFKALSGQRQNVLHLATHGFFWQDATATIDPMERSGLLLAGANLALSGHPERIPEGVEDGILTAKEISVLDFRNADIVVLSACETAKGDVSGEGVFGLQRAFKMAGAQTILMALWRVDDEATQILMAAFYRYYSQGMTKRQAFRKAQEEVRHHAKTERVDVPVPTTAVDKYKNKGKVSTVETTKTTYPYESPYYWAGFILLD